MNYIRTFSGTKFDTTPTADQVNLEDIAVALSRAPRFGGHTFWPYSVAAHSIYVSLLVPKRHRLQALFHDASEAYISDIPSPFKASMPDYKIIEFGIMEAVAERFDFNWPPDPIVKQADAAALYQEWKNLFKPYQGADDGIIPFVAPPCQVNWDFREWGTKTSNELACEFIFQANHLLHHSNES